MNVQKWLATGLLLAPFNVFAHAGHVEWPIGIADGGSEMLELALVISAIALYLLSTCPWAARINTTKTDRRKTG